MKRNILNTFVLGFLALASYGSAQNGDAQADKGNIKKAEAILSPTQGNQVSGVVTFVAEGDQIRVVADVKGLTPGKHGFHIHEKGDCSAPDGSSAGGHFNPDTHNHGAPDAKDRHAGDLGNIEADKDGNAHYEIVDSIIKLDGPNSIVGRAVIVHEKPDDFVTQPTGNAGNRLACGVIKAQ